MDTKLVQLRLQTAGHYSGKIDRNFGALSYGGPFSYAGCAISALTRDVARATAEMFPRCALVTPLRLARRAFETRNFRVMDANLDYFAKRIIQVWPSRFSTIAGAQLHFGKSRALANKVYGGRYGNDNVNRGWLLRGRGTTQRAFKDN